MKTFKINNQLEVVAESQNTRYGFRHIATLLKDNQEIDKAKACYYNRTWESYDFESVLKNLLEKTKKLTESERIEFKNMIEAPNRIEEDLAPLKRVADIMALGNIFGTTTDEKNSWKERMLKAGLENKGLIMPDDWETLSEEEKENRLNKVIEQCKQ